MYLPSSVTLIVTEKGQGRCSSIDGAVTSASIAVEGAMGVVDGKSDEECVTVANT